MEKGKDQDFVRELSEAIDKMLAGKRVEPCPGMSVNYQEAIDFAQRLITLKCTPRPSFEAQLKNKLLSKLTETEGEIKAAPEAKESGFWVGLRRLVPRQPVWRAVATTLIVVIVAGSVIWGTGIFSKPPVPAPAPAPAPAPVPAPTPAPGPEIFIEADATTDKSTYLPGEDVVIEFSFKNVSPEPFKMDPFPPSIEIRRPSVGETVRSFPAGTGIKSLDLGEVSSYALTWDQRDDQGQQVDYGYYYLKLGHIRLGDRSMSLGFGKLVRLLILPPEGVMERTIEVNESQMVAGITITLGQVEMTDSGLKVYAVNTPPDYRLSERPQPPLPQFMKLHAEAEYSLDGGPAKKTGPSGIRFLDEGMRHTWDMLDPVPKGTEELTFIITELGDWDGPWEFHIALQ